MLEAVIPIMIAAGGPVLTALAIEAKREAWLRRWRRDNFPIPYFPEGDLLSAQADTGSIHPMARVS